MPTFRPACAVNFKLYFDESLNPNANPPPPDTVDNNVRVPKDGASGQPTQEPAMLQRASQQASFIYSRQPKHLSVELPGYRQAGTFNATFDFRDLPIDPRTVQACAVEIHLGSVSHADFARGMVRSERDGSRASTLRTRDANGNPRQDTLVMVAYVDQWDVDEADRGAEVSLIGRDMRAPLLDTPIGVAPGVLATILDQLDLSQPINTVVKQLLSYNPLFGQFSVETNPAEWPNETVPAPSAADLVPRHRRGARGQRAGGRASLPGDSNNMSFWDLIVQLCYVVGAIPYFRGTALVIRPARSIFDQSRAGFDPTVRTPFANGQPRTVPGTNTTFNVRRLVYGRDIQKLHFSRKFGGYAKPKTVRCVSVTALHRGLDNVIQAQWPMPTAPAAARRNRTAPGGQQSQEEILTLPVPGIHDQGRLQEIARNLYEQIARLEFTGNASTRNLASLGGDNSDPDLLRLQPGDAVEFYTDVRELRARQPLVSTVTDHYRTPFEAQVNEIASRIGDRRLAEVIVATSRGQSAPTQRAFRVSTVKYTWTAAEALDIDFDFQNYYEARMVPDGVSTTAGEIVAVAVAGGATAALGGAAGAILGALETAAVNTNGGSGG